MRQTKVKARREHGDYRTQRQCNAERRRTGNKKDEHTNRHTHTHGGDGDHDDDDGDDDDDDDDGEDDDDDDHDNDGDDDDEDDDDSSSLCTTSKLSYTCKQQDVIVAVCLPHSMLLFLLLNMQRLRLLSVQPTSH